MTFVLAEVSGGIDAYSILSEADSVGAESASMHANVMK